MEQRQVLRSGEQRPGQRIKTLVEKSAELEGNLQAFFKALRELCAEQGLDHHACAQKLDEVLADHPDPEYAATLQRIMERLPEYEAVMERTVMSMETPPPQRYAVIQEQRRQLLGRTEAEMMFGQERALAEYRFAYGELMNNEAPGLGPGQRLQRLQQLQQQHFDTYQESLQQARGPHANYREERELLLLGVEDNRKREQITRQLREKYFDDETVARMRERDEELARQQAELEAYKADVAELKKSLAPLRETLTRAEWQARYEKELRALRLKHFSG